MTLLVVSCPWFGSSWGPAFNLPIFGFIVSFCCPCGVATDLLFIFGSLLPCLAYSFGRCCAIVNRALCMSVLSVFFPGACHYMQLSLFFLSIRFCSLSLQCFERFRLQFIYLDRSSSIFGIRFLMLFFVFFCISACDIACGLHLSL